MLLNWEIISNLQWQNYGGGQILPPPSLDSSMINIVDLLLSNFVNFVLWHIISNRMYIYFLVFDIKKVSYSLFILSKTSYEYYKTWQNRKNNKNYHLNYIWLLELLHTILEENRDKPLTDKQGQRDFDQKDYYGLWTDEYRQELFTI